MIFDKTYRIEPVTVFRLIDEEGKVVLERDDYGEHHLHYGSYTEALEDVQARRWLPFHGPLTEEKQKQANSWSVLADSMRRDYNTAIRELFQAESLPANAGKTITFPPGHQLGRQDEGFMPGERGNA